MNLQDYYLRYKLSAFNVLAKRCGSDAQYFYQLRTGRRKPSMELAKKIEYQTLGECPRQDTRPQDFEPVKARRKR